MINTIQNIDCLHGLIKMADNSIDCCVTSPPYYGLCDYGVEGQLGLEATPEEYVQKMVQIFSGVKRVLKDGGTLWLNLGDSYNGSGGAGGLEYAKTKHKEFGKDFDMGRYQPPKKIIGLKPKDLIGIPWMVAFALRADGWYLRQDIIWHKPNPMPESVTDRCTKAHEYVFLLSKSQRYYYDAEAIKEDALTTPYARGNIGKKNNGAIKQASQNVSDPQRIFGEDGKANKRSVWAVNTMPYTEAHFATFPEKLIVDMIKAGCPEGGIVLDPFMGAGTTAVVARKLNRNYIGFELNPDYIKIAENRLYNELGMYL